MPVLLQRSAGQWMCVIEILGVAARIIRVFGGIMLPFQDGGLTCRDLGNNVALTRRKLALTFVDDDCGSSHELDLSPIDPQALLSIARRQVNTFRNERCSK